MRGHRTFFLFAILFTLLVFTGCIRGTNLLTQAAEPAEVKGLYTLILYGCRYADDIENMAILVDEKSPYQFEVYALKSMYTVKRGLPASEALLEADVFVHCGMYSVRQTVLRRISDPNGKTIAYELKPLFRPWELRAPEVLLSSYILKEGTVTSYITLDPTVKRNDRLRDGWNMPGRPGF